MSSFITVNRSLKFELSFIANSLSFSITIIFFGSFLIIKDVKLPDGSIFERRKLLENLIGKSKDGLNTIITGTERIANLVVRNEVNNEIVRNSLKQKQLVDDYLTKVDDLIKGGKSEAEAIADRVGVINQGEIIVVDETKELLKKMGHKKLTVDLQEEVKELPSNLEKYNLEIGKDKMSIDYTYNVQAKQTGITNLLQDLKDAGLKLKDLKTEQSTLEKIFVSLVKENNEI